jgi:hypothetical protein
LLVVEFLLSSHSGSELHDLVDEGCVLILPYEEVMVNCDKDFKLEDHQLFQWNANSILELLVIEEPLIPFVVNYYLFIVFDCKDYAGTHEPI